jgi:hypothetical protein
MRVGDAEREAVAKSLREHYAHGRLTLEEFQERLDAVFAAKTDTDLAGVTRDLPHANPYAPPWPPGPSARVPAPGPGYPRGAGQGYGRPGAGPMMYGWLSLAIFMFALLAIAAFSWPFGVLPRALLILLAVLAFFRRILRRRFRGGRW